MFKYLITKGYVNVNKMLLENYPELGLSESELVVILKLFEMLKNNQVSISIANLAKKTSMSQNECSNVLNGLFNRGLVTINLDYTKQGKAKESFNLDEFINYVATFFENDIKNQMIEENKTQLNQMTSLVEQTFHRSLTPLELQMIVEWSQQGEKIENIQKALALTVGANKLNIKYVDSCLSAIKEKPSEERTLDEETTKILSDFYRKIK